MKKEDKYRIINGPWGGIEGITSVKPYNFKETGDGSVEVEMYGQVVESRPTDWWTGEPVKGLFIVLEEFLNDLDAYKEKEDITFRINSVGGDLFAGIAICNRISELKGNTVTIVDGLAASAASIILQGGKIRKAFAGSQVMVHGASVFMYGSYNQQDLKRVEKRIEGGNKSALEAYASRTGRDRGFLRGLMDREEWMTGQEAVENGFVDELTGSEEPVKLSVSADGKVIMSNGIMMPLGGLRNIPRDVPIMEDATDPLRGAAAINRSKTGGSRIMDKEELKQKYPELVQQIENEARDKAQDGGKEDKIRNEAVEKERKRLQEIGEIESQIADKELVNEAKFGERPMTAQELAFEAMKLQKNAGKAFLDNLDADAAGSGVDEVAPVPNSGAKTAGEEDAEDIENGASLIASAWK